MPLAFINVNEKNMDDSITKTSFAFDAIDAVQQFENGNISVFTRGGKEFLFQDTAAAEFLKQYNVHVRNALLRPQH